MKKARIVIGVIFSFALLGCKEKKSVDPKLLSCQNFVQNFYDWYLPIALDVQNSPAYAVALGEKKGFFSPELETLLDANLKIYRRQKDSIESLDFDPFLFSQDPMSEYKVIGPVLNGETCSVFVSAILNDKTVANPNLRVDLRQRNGEWTFLDFYYRDAVSGKETNLLQLLRGIVSENNEK